MAKAIAVTLDGITVTTLPAPVSVYQGEDAVLTFTFTTGSVSGTAATFTLRDRRAGTTQVTKTVGSGITVSGSTLTVTLTAADMLALDFGEYEYDLRRTDSSNVVTWAQGTLRILPR